MERLKLTDITSNSKLITNKNKIEHISNRK